MKKKIRLKASIFRLVYAGCVRYAIKIGQGKPQSYISVYNLATRLKEKERDYKKDEVIFKGLAPAQEAEFWAVYRN